MLKARVRIPVVLYGDGEECEKMEPNATVTKYVTLPFDFVPDHLDLAHCPTRDNKPTVDGSMTLRLSASPKQTHWDEVSGILDVWCETRHWHRPSFAHAIETMGQLGWEMTLN